MLNIQHMKFILLTGCLLVAGLVQAQEKVQPTSMFTIKGKVKKTVSIALAELDGFKTLSLDSVAIYNHKMEWKKTMRNIKGVLLKDILGKVEIDMTDPKLLSEIFITCVASDGYKIVFSWNELFNSAIGKKAIIITEMDGQKGAAINDHIVLLSPADEATGRRYVKGLKNIIIERVR
jgi:hypothetical protein